MKRLVLVAVALLVTVVGGVFIVSERAEVEAQNDRVIQVVTSASVEDGLGITYEAGESCSYSYPDSDLWMIGSGLQLLVRNQDDSIIAMQEVTGIVESGQDSSLYCRNHFLITVPDASFYSVYLGEDFIRAYDGAAFPLDLDNEGIYIGFD